jgi:4,5-dihydroxyphthalate decarboxylase
MALQLTLACGDYDRTHPLIDGSVTPEGIELNWLTLPHLEIWTRMLNYYDFDASEISLSSYIIARSLGKPLTAIPVFPARAFRHSYIFINTRSGIREPKDLMGKRVGLAEFQQTATVWMRGTLQHEYGVSLDAIEWFTWVPRSRMEMELPKRYKVTHLTPDKKPDEMLFNGELDAIMIPSLFPSLFNPPPHVRRLFEDSPKVEAEYYKKTGIFPIMHSIALREGVWEAHPWIARSLFKAFPARQGRRLRATERFVALQDQLGLVPRPGGGTAADTWRRPVAVRFREEPPRGRNPHGLSVRTGISREKS